TFFAAGAAQRAAAEAGLERAVSTREADDLIRAVETFYTQVEASLRLSTTPVLTATTDPQSVLTQSWMQAS
ncbi:MAG TPA: SAV_6107 family HEPN domain-containing protein, partial [Kribbella sp.]